MSFSLSFYFEMFPFSFAYICLLFSTFSFFMSCDIYAQYDVLHLSVSACTVMFVSYICLSKYKPYCAYVLYLLFSTINKYSVPFCSVLIHSQNQG